MNMPDCLEKELSSSLSKVDCEVCACPASRKLNVFSIMPSLDYTHPREFGPGSRTWYLDFGWALSCVAVLVETAVVSLESMD